MKQKTTHFFPPSSTPSLSLYPLPLPLPLFSLPLFFLLFSIVVTRSIGDTAANPKLGVIPDPEISIHTLSANDKYLVLGTDGLWDGLEIPELIEEMQLLGGAVNADKVSSSLLKKSLEGMAKRFLDDNNTNIVVAIRN